MVVARLEARRQGAKHYPMIVIATPLRSAGQVSASLAEHSEVEGQRRSNLGLTEENASHTLSAATRRGALGDNARNDSDRVDT